VPNTYISFNQSFTAGDQQYQTANIPFPFLNKEDIKVTATRTLPSALSPTIWTYVTEGYFNSTFVNGESSLPFGNYCVINENGQNKIKYKSASGNETYTITIYRRTFSSRTSQFTNGSPLQASDLNDLLLKSSYASEEAIEAVDAINGFGLSAILNNKYDKSGGTISGVSTISGSFEAVGGAFFNSNVDVGGTITLPSDLSGTLRNVPTPAYPNDAVNKAYVDSLTLNGGSPPVIEDNTITSEKLRKVAGEQAVATSTIRDLAVTGDKIANTTITGGKIANLAITSTKLATNSVTTSKITAGNVTSTSLADNAVITSKIMDNSITSAKLQSGVVTADKLASGSVTLDKLAVNSEFSGTLISNNTINDTKLTAPISWGVSPKTTTFTSAYTTINSNLAITGASINAENADVTLKSVKPIFTASPQSSGDILNNSGKLTLQTGGLNSNSFYNFNYNHLEDNINNQPLYFRTTNTQLNKPGYYDFEIYVPTKGSFKLGSTTIVQHVGQLNQNGNGVYSGANFPFAYKTIANIPFNKMRNDNGNSHISLNTQNYTLTFGSLPNKAKYKITLQGSCDCNRPNGTMIIKPLTNYVDQVYQTGTPLSSLYLSFNGSSNVQFSTTTLLDLEANFPFTKGVEYYYSDLLTSLPSMAHWDYYSPPYYPSYLGTPQSQGVAIPASWHDEWKSSYTDSITGITSTSFELNLARVQLIIERIG